MSSEIGQQSRAAASATGGDASPLVLVDGSNVAHSSEGDQALLGNIVLVCEKLREEGVRASFRDWQKVFPDAAKRLIRYMVVRGEVVLERRTERRDD